MDRRQFKTRQAIFNAFGTLLQKKRYENITVQEIIDEANVGRSTFYAHFETKDELTHALCQDLFCHIFDGTEDHGHKHLFSCDESQSVFVHLCKHLQNNDHQILNLLVRQNNAVFYQAFKKELIHLIEKEQGIMDDPRAKIVSSGYWVSYLADSFLSTIRWWYESGLRANAETVADSFLRVTNLQT